MSAPSAAAQVIVSIIPIVGIVMGSVIVFFFLMWDYKYKVFMIEKGFKREYTFNLTTFCLLSGLILFILGLCLVIFFLIKDGFSYGVLSGLIPFGVGMSLLMFVKISGKMKSGNE